MFGGAPDAGRRATMSALDDILGDLSRGVGALSTRATSALYAAAAAALQPAFHDWAAVGSRQSTEPLLEQAIEVGFELARTGTTQADLADILRRLEMATPAREALDSAPSTAAQDCLICADVALRVHVEPAFAKGPVIEYALEPVLMAATGRVSAVQQPDDGSEAPAAADALLEDSRVLAAVEFMWFALMRLRGKNQPDPATIDAIRTHATVLLP
jgi:hypothetical protein